MVYSTPGLSNKLSVIFKGPGWLPGLPRLGREEDIPDVSLYAIIEDILDVSSCIVFTYSLFFKFIIQKLNFLNNPWCLNHKMKSFAKKL